MVLADGAMADHFLSLESDQTSSRPTFIGALFRLLVRRLKSVPLVVNQAALSQSRYFNGGHPVEPSLKSSEEYPSIQRFFSVVRPIFKPLRRNGKFVVWDPSGP
jgi:hypothetical protein